jgi:uncharacterized repeat protein (TIGR03803 family)
VFALTPPASPGGAWTEQILYSFTGENGVTGDGYNPETKLAFGPGGSAYETTPGGGIAPGHAIVFSPTPPESPEGNWTETVLHAFTGADGSGPGAVILGEGGVLYGTTVSGGSGGFGTVFGLPL